MFNFFGPKKQSGPKVVSTVSRNSRRAAEQALSGSIKETTPPDKGAYLELNEPAITLTEEGKDDDSMCHHEALKLNLIIAPSPFCP